MPTRAFQERVMDEHLELVGRLSKLRDFIASERFTDLDEQNQDLLLEQAGVMDRYAEVLEDRITLFK